MERIRRGQEAPALLAPMYPGNAYPKLCWRPYVVSPQVHKGLRLLGRSVRRARHRARLTQQHLENASGVDQTIISRLENGKLLSMRIVQLAALVEAIDAYTEGGIDDRLFG